MKITTKLALSSLALALATGVIVLLMSALFALLRAASA